MTAPGGITIFTTLAFAFAFPFTFAFALPFLAALIVVAFVAFLALQDLLAFVTALAGFEVLEELVEVRQALLLLLSFFQEQ